MLEVFRKKFQQLVRLIIHKTFRQRNDQFPCFNALTFCSVSLKFLLVTLVKFRPKIIPHSLDFYDVFEKTSANYAKVEGSTINYVKRTLEKRITVYTHDQIQLNELFDIEKNKLDEYLKILFFASAGIPRCLGYVLTYYFLGSINQGEPITISNINNAAEKYYTNNILPDFFNDVRF